MKHRLYAPIVLATGMASAQIVATAHVYRSNLDILQVTDSLTKTGYLSIPNARVAEQLDSLAPALAGGAFFTLSVGAGLSLATLVAVWLWDRAFRRRRKASAILIGIWAALFFLMNRDGWNPVASTYLLTIPLTTAISAVALLPKRTILVSPFGVLWPVSAVIVLALLWSGVLDNRMFTNIRDHLLMANRTGKAITHAYYAYTLFPAEAFKSLNQKLIRTCRLGDTFDRSQWIHMEQAVRSHDYLPLPSGYPVDVTITMDPDQKQIDMVNHKRSVVQLSEKEFFLDPAKALESYSRDRDRYKMFRTLTLGCLLLGFPLVLFTFVFSAASILPNLFLTISMSDVITSVFCMGVGIALLVPVYKGHAASASPVFKEADLSSPSASVRIAALRQACSDQRDILPEARKHGIADSSNIAERYWLARCLAYAKGPKAPEMLLSLAADPAPIVACQALWAMGRRKNRDAIPPIIDRITASSHWYIQMYGYRALRKLGWVQPQSLHPF